MLERQEPRPPRFPLDLTSMRSEVEAALQSTTEMLSQVTRLLALVSAPGLETASVRHVEVLLLQPSVVMVVTITSAGGVAKKLITFDRRVDPGLAAWANEYLNERLVGVGIGTHTLRTRIDDPGLTGREREFIDALRPALRRPGRADGAVALRRRRRVAPRRRPRRRARGLPAPPLRAREAGRRARADDGVVRRPAPVRPRRARPPGLHDVALVGATYGLPTRTLGSIGLLGPVRMDYDKAVRTVRAAAHELSRLVEAAYEED